jgi:high-affinity iron transporter
MGLMFRRLLLIMLVSALLALVWLPAWAQADSASPPQTAEMIRQRLFDAQVALMRGDRDDAHAAVADASDLYERELRPVIRRIVQANDARIVAAFQSARTTENAADLATARGQIRAALLDSAYRIVLHAIEQGDAETAARWLPLRDFRASTRFSRPEADATLAVEALRQGRGSAEDAASAVTADLLDTYQAQLSASLNSADAAHARGFSLRRAEEVGLAAGYFTILEPAYRDQRGNAAAEEAAAAYRALIAAALADDGANYETARTQIDALMAGFRAAPLSEAELARRAGQMLRFLALVAIEYSRGVRPEGGVITADIEIQEAITFLQGASSAYADLQSTVAGLDAEVALRTSALLQTAQEQIRTVAAPSDLKATVDRISADLTAVLPAEWLQGGSSSDIDVILSVLDQVQAAVRQGNYALAESARLEAYALLELGLEQRLNGFAPELAIRIESLFWQGTSDQTGLAALLAERSPLEMVQTNLNALEIALNDAQQIVSGETAPAAVIGNAAIIVFREGLEAVLILASLLASLRAAEGRRFRRPLIAGAGLALAATVVTWLLAHQLLTVLLPFGERLEAVVSLIAIGVLLLIMNWFFHKVYWTDWMARFHQHKRRLTSGAIAVSVGQTVGLILLGFTSIYREGFETVLFLQSLVLEAGMATVQQGVGLGLIGVSIVGVVTFALQVRLPYKKMLIVTGVMIGAVLLVMVGHTVHTLQSVGWLPITPIQGIYLPFWLGQWFGLFPTWQGIVLQFAAAGFVIGSYFLAERQSQKIRLTAARAAQTS